jgi:hypothetical protein
MHGQLVILTALIGLCYSMPHSMRTTLPSSLLTRGLSLALIALMLALAPFAVAQDVHHELAAADTDGHEHSETDLCQWVQHHTSGSFDLGGSPCSAFEIVRAYDPPAPAQPFSVEFPLVSPSRAPPHV